MDKLDNFAKLGDFIPHGDDSIIDDDGIYNRWAQRRRERRAAEQERLRQINPNPEVQAELDRIQRLARASQGFTN